MKRVGWKCPRAQCHAVGQCQDTGQRQERAQSRARPELVSGKNWTKKPQCWGVRCIPQPFHLGLGGCDTVPDSCTCHSRRGHQHYAGRERRSLVTHSCCELAVGRASCRSISPLLNMSISTKFLFYTPTHSGLGTLGTRVRQTQALRQVRALWVRSGVSATSWGRFGGARPVSIGIHCAKDWETRPRVCATQHALGDGSQQSR